MVIDEIPSHEHGCFGGWSDGSAGIFYIANKSNQTIKKTNSAGGDKPHNHGSTSEVSALPPYNVISTWKRIS